MQRLEDNSVQSVLFLLPDMDSGNQIQSLGLIGKYLYLAEPVLKKMTEGPYNLYHLILTILKSMNYYYDFWVFLCLCVGVCV